MDYFDGVKGRDSKISLGSCIRPSPNEGYKKKRWWKEDPRESRHSNFKCPAKIWTSTGHSPNSSRKNTNNGIHHSSFDSVPQQSLKCPSVAEIKVTNDIALYWNYFTDMKTGGWNSPAYKATPEVKSANLDTHSPTPALLRTGRMGIDHSW